MNYRWLLTAVGLTASALAAGCDSGASPQQQKGPAALPTVTASMPVRREIVEWDEYTGRFDSVETVEIRARVSGYLNEVHFKDGQTVKQGDLLFVLDVTRGRPLLERRVISEKTFDDRENLVRDAQAAVKVAEAKVKTAELDLSFTRITSPLSGRISRNMASVGNWISAGGTASATLLTTIVSQDPIHIYFDVSENNYIKYKRLAERGEDAGAADVGATVEIALPDERGYPHKGTLDFLDNRLDQGTGTLRARAVVNNKSGLFSPGLFARVRVTGSAKYTALLLPEEAIGTDQTNKYVYVVGDDGMVARRNVQLGPTIEGLRVVREGIAGNEWLITKGMQRARPGQSVAANRVAQAVSTADEGGAGAGKAKQ
jgi:RND family efflux transporter MFP subunit